MDLHRYDAIRRLWRRSPPLQTMVQAYLGIEEPAEPLSADACTDDQQAAIENFARNFAAAGGIVH